MSEVRLSLSQVQARSRRGAGSTAGRLAGVSLELGPGVHGVLGTAADGTALLVEVATGRVRPTAGALRIGGGDPHRSASIRGRIASLGPLPELPERLTVRQVVEAAADAGGWPAHGVLAARPWAAAARRRIRGLSHGERRALELVIALAHPEPLVLLLYEPWRRAAAVVTGELRAALRDRAGAGVCVVVVTSAPQDVLGWVDTVTLLRKGLTGAPPALGAADLERASRQLFVWVSGVRGGGAPALARALSGYADLDGVGWQRGPVEDAAGSAAVDLVAVRAADLDAAALHVAREAVRLGVEVRSVHGAAPTLDQLARSALEIAQHRRAAARVEGAGAHEPATVAGGAEEA